MSKNKNIFATKKDIDELKIDFKKELNRFATKDDLKAFATKDDLKAFATKDDLKGIKQEMKNFATKQDLKKMVDAIALQIVEMNKKTIKEIHNDVLSFKDEIIHDYVKVQDDFVVVKGWGDKIEDHEERILSLENCATA